ncbi:MULTISPECIES: glutathione S-transferase [Psychrobacter]|jgi:glutathione S-transferase|uniref:glutathione S-transferase n=1 Tax=Psychrobacter TaxID=497 RepID=UPI000414E989|nr:MULTISPECIES: glutathione S-transferase [Psychrobacter]NRD69305.1 glutathione S-transferase [Psychrobacter okhotskensis]PKG35232.1 glutathione S-transferase [Psychrobacter sp. Sarcosine-3u-12]
MLHLHHLANSRSFRILWLLEELKADYQLTCYERNKAYRAPDSLKEVHPLGHAPILEVDGRPLIESGFIIEYLLKHYDKAHQFKPADDNEAAWEAYTFWLHFAEASVMPPLVMRLVFTKVVEQSPMLIKPVSKSIRTQVEKSMITNSLNKILDMMEQHLQDNHWFAGEDFSAADIQMHLAVVGANAGPGLDKSKYTNILNWLKHCEERDAFKRAEEKGGRLTF